MPLDQVILAIAPAIAVAVFIGLIAWWLWKRKKIESTYSCGALACGLGFLASFLVINKHWPSLPPQERWQWVFYAAIAAMTIGLIATAIRAPFAWRVVFGVAVGFVVSATLHPVASVSQPALWRAIAGVYALALWFSLDWVSSKQPSASAPLAMCILFAGLSGVLVESRQARLALIDSGAAALLGPIVLLALIAPSANLMRGGNYVLAALLTMLLATGWFYTSDPSLFLSYVLLAAAPFALWVGEVPYLRVRKPRVIGVVQIAAVCIVVIIAVAYAIKQGEGSA